MRVAFVHNCGLPINKNSCDEGSIGGSETAFIAMARELTNLGHEVTAYCRTESDNSFHLGSTQFHPMNMYHGDASQYDVAVYCRDLSPVLGHTLNAKYVVNWMHDMPGSHEWLMRQKACMWAIDEVFFLSEFQRNCWSEEFRALDFVSTLTSNGLDRSLIEKVKASSPDRDPKKLIYSSRWERGLINALNIFTRLLFIDPAYKLVIASYVDPAEMEADPQRAELYDHVMEIVEASPSISYKGSLNKRQLYEEMCTARAVILPTKFPEIYCITAIEALACGTPFISSNFGALPETIDNKFYAKRALIEGDPESDQYQIDFIEAILKPPALHDPGKDWSEIAEQWENHFLHELQLKGYPVDRGGKNLIKRDRKEETIALCMIVKDEEDDIGRCLNSVLPFVDHAKFIIDDRTSDNTLEIITDRCSKAVKDPEHRLHDFEFLTETFTTFDRMRNMSMKGIKQDWILWMDADETLMGGKNIQGYLKSQIFKGFAIRQWQFSINQNDVSKPSENEFNTPLRLFRNGEFKSLVDGETVEHIRFIGCIHEHPELGMNRPVYPAAVVDDVHFAHYGYLEERVRREKVILRNLDLLRRDREENPERLIGHSFSMRDLVQMFKWGAEKGQVNGELVEKAIKTWKEIFMEDALTERRLDEWDVHLIPEAKKWAQEAMLLANRFEITVDDELPFCVKLFMSIEKSGIPDDPDKFEKRWFCSQYEYRAFMEKMTNLAVSHL